MKSKNNTPIAESGQFRLAKTTLGVLVALGCLNVSVANAAEEETAKAEEEVEVILVKGIRSSIISAQEAKMDADKIMDGISADDIGALPDRSVTETVQRVPGVAIDRYMTQGDPEHFSVEGSGVIVRGLTQVRAELNGRSTFSATGGRSLSFGDVSPELLAAVNVYKSPSADQIEGGLAGTIDLVTRYPLSEGGQKFMFSTTVNYGDFSEEAKPEASFLYTNTWDTAIGKVGFLVDVAYSELQTRNDSIYVRPFFKRDSTTNVLEGYEGDTTYVPRGADWRTMNFARERQGQYAALQWQPNDNHKFTLTYFNSEYDMQWDEDAIFVGNDGATVQVSGDHEAIFDDNGVLEKGRLMQADSMAMGADIRVAQQEAKTTDYSLEYQYFNDMMEFSFEAQRVTSESNGKDNTVATEIVLDYMDVDFTGSVPTLGSDEDYMADPSNYTWNFAMDQTYARKAEMDSIQADVKFFLDTPVIKAIKVGGRYADSTANNADTQYNWSPLAPSWLQWAITEDTIDNINPSADDLNLNTFDDFFGGKVASPSNVYAPKLHWAANHPDSFQELQDRIQYREDSWQSWAYWNERSLDDTQWQNNQSETTTAAYLMANYEVDLGVPVSGNFGVRYVKTEATSHGNLIYPSNDLFYSDFEVIDAEHEYSNVLPSFNMKVELTEELLLRFAAAKAIARIDFSQLGANMSLSADVLPACEDDEERQATDKSCFALTGAPSIEGSNPYRDPMESTQFDLSLEWYYGEGSSAYMALFSKDITGYESSFDRAEEYQGDTYMVRRYGSEGTADIKGAEISLTHWFNSLPAPFDGIGIQANYTYIDSTTFVGEDGGPLDTDGSSYDMELPFKGLSEHSYNLAFMYQKDDFEFRMAYNWRSEYLMAIGANGYNGSTTYWYDDGSSQQVDWRLPVYGSAEGYLDAQVAYQISDNFKLAFKANNLADTITNNTVKQNGVGDYYGAYHKNDIRYALTLTGTF